MGGGLPQGHHLLADGPRQDSGGIGVEPAQGQARDPVADRMMNIVHETEGSGHSSPLPLELRDGGDDAADDEDDEPAAEGQPPSGRTGAKGNRGGQE